MDYLGDNVDILKLAMFFAPKVLIALVCGGIIGLEREIKQKSAGLKTNMLICTGSALYTGLSVLISYANSEYGFFGDPGRLAAQIVSGIGFLGAGAIIQGRGNVQGLTTAATIWVVAAIGVAIGMNYYSVAVGSTLLVVTVLTLVSRLERVFLGNTQIFSCHIAVVDPEGRIRRGINEVLSENDLTLDDFDMMVKNKTRILKIKYRGSWAANRKFLLALWAMPGVQEVKQK